MSNLYEYEWTALRVTQLLKGKVSRIRWEPLGSAGEGVDLEVEIDGITWVEQVKRSPHNWTINRLSAEGVLAAMITQIRSGRHFRFVGSTPAEALRTLANRAGKAVSFEEFTEAIGKGRSKDLAKIAEEWEVCLEEAWGLLKRVEVECHSEDSLKGLVNLALESLFEEEPGHVLSVLRMFCECRIHENLNAEEVWGSLEALGLRRRPLEDEWEPSPLEDEWEPKLRVELREWRWGPTRLKYQLVITNLTNRIIEDVVFEMPEESDDWCIDPKEFPRYPIRLRPSECVRAIVTKVGAQPLELTFHGRIHKGAAFTHPDFVDYMTATPHKPRSN